MIRNIAGLSRLTAEYRSGRNLQSLVGSVRLGDVHSKDQAGHGALLFGLRESDPLLHVRVPQLEDAHAVDAGMRKLTQ